MARIKSHESTQPTKKIRPALNPESREQQLIALAVDLVEKRLIEGTASSQETTHFLKLAASDYKLKIQKLEEENKLLSAKTEAIHAAKRQDEMFEAAIKAMRMYSGNGGSEDDDEEDY